MRTRTDLERVLDLVAECHVAAPDEIAANLRAWGVDVPAAKAKLLASVRARLSPARVGVTSRYKAAFEEARAARTLQVRALALSIEELMARLVGRQPQVAHRDLKANPREDLESQLAELLALEDVSQVEADDDAR